MAHWRQETSYESDLDDPDIINSNLMHSNRGVSSPRITTLSNTYNLANTEFTLLSQVASGYGCLKRKWPRNNIAEMVTAREKGIPLCSAFSHTSKCRMANEYVPNEMEILDRHSGSVYCGIFSKDGEYFMAASQDRLISIYDSNNGSYKKLNEIWVKRLEWSIIDLAFSPNREHILYTTWRATLQLCKIHDDSHKEETLQLPNAGNQFCVFGVVFSASGDEVIAGCNDTCIYIYDLEQRKCSSAIMAHECDVNTVALATESSKIIYSGGDDGLIKVWDRRTLNENAPKPVGILAGHMDGITYIDSRGDGRHLISNSKDQSIKLWDIRVFSSHNAIESGMKIVQEQPWDYRWQKVPIKLFNEKKLEGDTSLMTYRGHVVIKTLVRCKFSPIATTGQRYIYTGCGLGQVVIYDALTGQIKHELEGHRGLVRDVSWHPYRNEILSSSWDGSIGIWRYSSVEHSFNENDNDDSLTDSYTSEPGQPLRRSTRLARKRRRER